MYISSNYGGSWVALARSKWLFERYCSSDSSHMAAAGEKVYHILYLDTASWQQARGSISQNSYEK